MMVRATVNVARQQLTVPGWERLLHHQFHYDEGDTIGDAVAHRARQRCRGIQQL